MRRGYAFAAILFSAVACGAGTLMARAQDFDPEYILSDAEIRRVDSMSLTDISFFLARHGGLAGVTDVDAVDGRAKPAAQLIYDAARRYDINPQYVLALIQKESSVVDTAEPTRRQLDWAAGYALCDGCSVDDPLPLKYKGFAKQVDAGAGWMDWFLKGADGGDYTKPGQPFELNGTTVTPANLVTAGLYSYTPHLHGNQLLWDIMQRWFGGGVQAFPDGTLVRNAKNGAVALIEGERFRPILKKSVLLTRFGSANIVDLDPASFAALEQGDRGSPVRFPDLSVVQTETGARYLLIGNAKRLIPDARAFSALGFNPEEVEPAAAADLADYDDGAPLVPDSPYPLGELLQDTSTGGVYYAESGTKRPIIDAAILKAKFPGRAIVGASQAELAALANGGPIVFPDGTLVKSAASPTVYLISAGRKRAFATEKDFKTLGFSFRNVLTAGEKALALHPAGLPIDMGLADAPAAAAAH